MNKIRRYTLAQNTSPQFHGLGILTDEPDYRICWLLNQSFSWNLVRSDDILVTDKNSPVAQSFPCFENKSEQQSLIRLISNRSKEGQWLTIFRQIDFLLITGQDDEAGYLDELKTSIGTKIPQIRGLFKVPLPSFCYL